MSDPDLPTESLVIIVEELPSNGDIIIASEGKDAKVNKGENFTVQDVENGMVRFKHHKGDDQKGKSFNPVSHSGEVNDPEKGKFCKHCRETYPVTAFLQNII